MTIPRNTVLDQVSVDEIGNVSVREATYIVDDGNRIGSPEYHRYVLSPGDTIDADEYDRVKQIVATVWTPSVIAAYQARVSASVAGPVAG